MTSAVDVGMFMKMRTYHAYLLTAENLSNFSHVCGGCKWHFLPTRNETHASTTHQVDNQTRKK